MSLALICQDAFKVIIRLQSGASKGQTAAQVKTALLKILDTIDVDAKADQIKYSEDNLKDAKFALTAFADESAKSISDPLMNQWDTPPNVSLTQELFNQANAGNDFYNRLDRISRTDTRESGEVLEVYCLCMLLGFTGAQRGEQLSATIQNTLKKVQGLLGRSPGLEFPTLLVGDSHLSEEAITPRLPRRTTWPLAVVVAASLVYLSFCGVLKHGSNQLVDLIHIDRR